MYFFCFRKPVNSKFAAKTTKRKLEILSFLAEKLPKRLIFYRPYDKSEEDEISRSEFYYPEDLETSNVETESGTGESQEAIDDFIKKKKCVKTNRQMATDLKTLLHSTNCKVTVWQMRELKSYLRRSLTTSCPLKYFL